MSIFLLSHYNNPFHKLILSVFKELHFFQTLRAGISLTIHLTLHFSNPFISKLHNNSHVLRIYVPWQYTFFSALLHRISTGHRMLGLPLILLMWLGISHLIALCPFLQSIYLIVLILLFFTIISPSHPFHLQISSTLPQTLCTFPWPNHVDDHAHYLCSAHPLKGLLTL